MNLRGNWHAKQGKVITNGDANLIFTRFTPI